MGAKHLEQHAVLGGFAVDGQAGCERPGCDAGGGEPQLGVRADLRAEAAGLGGGDDVGDGDAIGVEDLDAAQHRAPLVVVHRDEAVDAGTRRAAVVAVAEGEDAAGREHARRGYEKALDRRGIRQVGERVAEAEHGVRARAGGIEEGDKVALVGRDRWGRGAQLGEQAGVEVDHGDDLAGPCQRNRVDAEASAEAEVAREAGEIVTREPACCPVERIARAGDGSRVVLAEELVVVLLRAGHGRGILPCGGEAMRVPIGYSAFRGASSRTMSSMSSWGRSWDRSGCVLGNSGGGYIAPESPRTNAEACQTRARWC